MSHEKRESHPPRPVPARDNGGTAESEARQPPTPARDPADDSTGEAQALPTPARDAAGAGTPPPPARPNAAGPPATGRSRNRGRRSRKGPAQRPSSPSDSSRPTPVREAMAAESSEAAPDPTREFEVDGKRWVARIAGRGLTGSNVETAAPLMHLTFHEGDEGAPPSRELLLVGTGLDSRSDDELAELLARSDPYREPKPPERKRRGRRGGRS